MCVTVAQPTDVVKIRMQAAGALPGQKPFTGVFNAYANIYRKEGLHGLWKGRDNMQSAWKQFQSRRGKRDFFSVISHKLKCGITLFLIVFGSRSVSFVRQTKT